VAMRISCWFGRHVLTTRVEQGESYTVCSKCGKTPRSPERQIEHHGSDSIYHGHPPGSTVGGGGGDVGTGG